jgi:hypothetical protein
MPPTDELIDKIDDVERALRASSEQTRAEIDAQFEQIDAEIRRTFARLRVLDAQFLEELQHRLGLRQRTLM